MYKTSNEIQKEFEKELKELLHKYNATMEIDDIFTSRPFVLPDKTITVEIPAKYRDDGSLSAEYTVIDLGSYFD